MPVLTSGIVVADFLLGFIASTLTLILAQLRKRP